jgi:gas vesicle protein
MQAMEFGKGLPSAEEILRAIGLQRARSNNDFLSGVAVFGAGMLVGAALGLLFAPSSGAEIREELGSRLGEVRDQVAQRLEQAKRTATASNGG